MGRSSALLVAILLGSLVVACGGNDRAPASSPPAPTPTAGGTTPGTAVTCTLPAAGTHVVVVDGVERTFDVYPPLAPADGEPLPTLVAFHGFNSSKEQMVALTGLDVQAPAAGVLLVVPQGAGAPAGWDVLADFEQDRAFTDALLAEVQEATCVAGGDLWLTGFSAGSAFAAVYGCRDAAAVTGLGLVAALAPAICPPEDTPTVLITHGSADPVVPFGGGDQAVGEAKVALGSVTESATTWATRAGCGPDATTETVGADVTVTRWTGCAGGSTVTLQVVDGGGHAWPGAVEPVALGTTTQTISTSCVLLAAIVDPARDPFPDCPGDGPSS